MTEALARLRPYLCHKVTCKRGEVVEPVPCPSCGESMRRVRNDSGYLNDYQFDAVKAGDWFCKRHDPIVYVWDVNVQKHGCTCDLDTVLAGLEAAPQDAQNKRHDDEQARGDSTGDPNTSSPPHRNEGDTSTSQGTTTTVGGNGYWCPHCGCAGYHNANCSYDQFKPSSPGVVPSPPPQMSAAEFVQQTVNGYNALIVPLLKHLGNRPRVHGNGFVQLDLSASVRLHVWGDSRIPRQKTDTPIHNHTFGFTSYVLKGAIEQRVYRVSEDGFYEKVYQPHLATVRHGEDTVLAPVGEKVGLGLDCQATRIVRAGESYAMQAGEIHESRPLEPSVTIIVKDGPSLSQCGLPPLVYVRDGIEPDNAFDRYATPQELLWEIIEAAITPAGVVPSPRGRAPQTTDDET